MLNESKIRRIAQRLLDSGALEDEPAGDPSTAPPEYVRPTPSCLPRTRWVEIDDRADLTADEAQHVAGCRYCTIIADMTAGENAEETEFRQVVQLPAIRLLAASEDDQLVASVPMDPFTLNLWLTPIRADLAVELVLGPEQDADADGGVFLIDFGDAVAPVAVFPNESPVFTGILMRDIGDLKPSIGVTQRYSMNIAKEEQAIVARSGARLVHGSSRSAYDRFIRETEGDI